MILLLALLLAQAAEPPGVRLQDEGVAKGTIDTLNCVGAGIACARAGRKGTLTVAGGGASGDLTGVTTLPSAPAAGLVTPLAYGLFGPAQPGWMSGDLGFALPVLPAPWDAGKPFWGCLLPHLASGGAPYGSGLAVASAVGTFATFPWATTDVRTRAPWGQSASSGTASSSALVRNTFLTLWRGNAAGLGGFWLHGAFGVVGTVPANQRAFFGLYGTAAGLTAAADPSAALDQVGFQCDAGQTTLRIGSNDASGVATVTDLGANFPCTTTGIAYDWWLWAAPNASTISYAIREMVGGFTASGTLSTDLPTNTVRLAPQMWINNGGTAASATATFGPTCWVANQ